MKVSLGHSTVPMVQIPLPAWSCALFCLQSLLASFPSCLTYSTLPQQPTLSLPSPGPPLGGQDKREITRGPHWCTLGGNNGNVRLLGPRLWPSLSLLLLPALWGMIGRLSPRNWAPGFLPKRSVTQIPELGSQRTGVPEATTTVS